MNKKGPIIIVEDDEDDRIILTEVFKNLNYKNEIIFLDDPEEAFNFLVNTEIEPFIVLSDMNMPRLNGLELRERVHENENLRLKCIPYLFFTTSAEQKYVIDAYSKSVQGFFIKPTSSKKLEEMIRRIVEYWQDCVSPNYIK